MDETTITGLNMENPDPNVFHAAETRHKSVVNGTIGCECDACAAYVLQEPGEGVPHPVDVELQPCDGTLSFVGRIHTERETDGYYVERPHLLVYKLTREGRPDRYFRVDRAEPYQFPPSTITEVDWTDIPEAIRSGAWRRPFERETFREEWRHLSFALQHGDFDYFLTDALGAAWRPIVLEAAERAYAPDATVEDFDRFSKIFKTICATVYWDRDSRDGDRILNPDPHTAFVSVRQGQGDEWAREIVSSLSPVEDVKAYIEALRWSVYHATRFDNIDYIRDYRIYHAGPARKLVEKFTPAMVQAYAARDGGLTLTDAEREDIRAAITGALSHMLTDMSSYTSSNEFADKMTSLSTALESLSNVSSEDNVQVFL